MVEPRPRAFECGDERVRGSAMCRVRDDEYDATNGHDGRTQWTQLSYTNLFLPDLSLEMCDERDVGGNAFEKNTTHLSYCLFI